MIFNLNTFCTELLNFEKNKDYWNVINKILIKSLDIKGSKIPRKFDPEFKEKSNFFKNLNKSLNYKNIMLIRDGWGINNLNIGLLSFDFQTPEEKNLKILFVEEDYLTYFGMNEIEVFVPIKILNNKSVSKDIIKEVMKYYNTYNRFGVKLTVSKDKRLEEYYDYFQDNIFSDISVFLNQDENLFDISQMKKEFKKGFNMKVKNEIYEFRNYFNEKEQLAPSGPFNIYFYKVNFKKFPNVRKASSFIEKYHNPKNAHDELLLK